MSNAKVKGRCCQTLRPSQKTSTLTLFICTFPVSVWLAFAGVNSLINASPLPENRGGSPPKEVQKINKWLGVSKKSDILKDILEVAKNMKKIKNIKETIEGNWFI